MGAPDILMRLAGAGISLSPLPDGRLWAAPSAALTDELRDLIRANRAELRAALGADPLPDAAAESRRQKVLTMLADNPDAKYAVATYDRIDPDVVILVLAIRGRVTCELHVPKSKYDGVLLLDLIEKHGATVH